MTTAATILVLGEATLGELEQGLRGQLVRRGDGGYDEARAIWNGAYDRRPALIVRCDGAYVNFMGDAGDQRLRASHGEAKYERLVALKRRYDAANLFRLNQNITP
jgi:hypothetical protein